MINDFQSVLTNKKFLQLWASQLLSQVTINVMNFILLSQLFLKTGSSIATALLWVAYSLPAIIVGPIGAVSVDMVSRRKMLMATNLLQALAVFLYSISAQQSTYMAYSLVLTYSLLNQFYAPAESASLPSVVNPEDLPHANSIFLLTQQGAIVLGFGISGILLSSLSVRGSLYLCSLLLFLAFVSVSFLPKLRPKNKIPKGIEVIARSLYKSIIEGYVFIKGNKVVLFPLLLIIALQVSVTVIAVLVPVISNEIFNIPVHLAGTLLIMPSGLGALIGSIVFGRLLKQGVRKRKIVEKCLLLGFLGITSMAFALPFIPNIFRLFAGGIILVFLGIAFIGINIPTVTFLQETVPQNLRGRVFGNMWFVVTIISVFPVLFSGIISEIFGVKTLLALIGFGCFMVFLYSRQKWSTIFQ